jgi:hypothetical protein
MKRVLLDYRGLLNEVVEVGSEFPVYEGPDAAMKWVLCPHDEVTTFWHCSEGNWISPENKLDYDQNMKRKIAYGDLGDQLDMLYKDIKAGNLESGSWVQRIEEVKSTIESQSSYESNSANFENKVQIKVHTPEDPSWNYLPSSDLNPPKFYNEN